MDTSTSSGQRLGDALGSVRQLADASGAVTYSRAYDPYGVVTSTTGTSSTTYGYTSEYYGDSTQLTYLRSRFYANSTGRFLTRDTWGGDANHPLSFNKWIYGGQPCKSNGPNRKVLVSQRRDNQLRFYRSIAIFMPMVHKYVSKQWCYHTTKRHAE